jgi:tripartite-type tricarboxylate transporter receptor subunit TctC
MAQPALREAIARIGLVPTYADGAGVAARMRAENVRWKPIVAESGFRPED